MRTRKLYSTFLIIVSFTLHPPLHRRRHHHQQHFSRRRAHRPSHTPTNTYKWSHQHTPTEGFSHRVFIPQQSTTYTQVPLLQCTTQQSANHAVNTSPFDISWTRCLSYDTPHLQNVFKNELRGAKALRARLHPPRRIQLCVVIHHTLVRSRHSGPSPLRDSYQQDGPASSRGSLSSRLGSPVSSPSYIAFVLRITILPSKFSSVYSPTLSSPRIGISPVIPISLPIQYFTTQT